MISKSIVSDIYSSSPLKNHYKENLSNLVNNAHLFLLLYVQEVLEIWNGSYGKLLYEMGQYLLELWYGSIELNKKTGLISINWVPTY